VLSPAEQSLVRRDVNLPGLATLLDDEMFLEELKKALPDLGLSTARRTYIRHKPGMNCLVRYEVGNSEGTFDVYAKTYSSFSNEKLNKAKERASVTTALGFGRILLDSGSIQVCAFPNDDKLKTLLRLGVPGQGQGLVSRIFTPDSGLPETVSLETLQYKPERRYVAQLKSSAGDVAAAKFYTSHAFDQAYRNARHVTDETDSLFPRLIGRSKRHHILAFEWIRGTVLNDEFRSPDFDIRYVHSLAEALSSFHIPKFEGLAPQDTSAKAAKLAAHARGIGFLVPKLERQAARLARELARELEHLPNLSFRIHNDLYAKQVLCTDDGIRLVDSDDICLGHPAADLGLFIAHLERNIISGGLDPALARSVRSALIKRYRPHIGYDIIGSVDLFVSLGLMQLTHHPYRTCLKNWPEVMAMILDRADHHLQEYLCTGRPGKTAVAHGSYSGVDVDDPFDIGNDPAMPSNRDALDPGVIAPILSRLIGVSGQPVPARALKSIRALRHKPGRRCVIEYCFRTGLEHGRQDTYRFIGKKRARGLDLRTFRVNAALYSNGFGQGCPDGIEVPQPIGCIPELNMWIQRSVSGQNPFPLFHKNEDPTVGKRIAGLLFKLHSANVPSKRQHDLQDEMTILETQLGKVADSNAHMKERIHAVLSACRDLCDNAPEPRYTGIHRDFYHDQVLVRPGKIYLLDLDLYCIGDPALDLGNFIAHIEEQSLREFNDVTVCERAVDLLISHYCDLVGEDISEAIEMYSTLSFVRHIAISQRITKRNGFTERIIEICESKLGSGQKT